MAVREVASKMKKYNALLAESSLVPHLPSTEWFEKETLSSMLDAYPTVFVKPVAGTGGKGIIRIRKTSGGYEVRHGAARTVTTKGNIYRTTNRYINTDKRYIVQRGIPLASYKGGLFDLRIYMQKPENSWLISGKIARVASPGRFITNYHRGGKGVSLETALSFVFAHDADKVNKCVQDIENVCHEAANALDQRFPGLRTLGFDIGVQSNGHVWIIEANTRPKHNLFKLATDQSMHKTILKNKRIIRKKYK
ncbi:YheC/YheD family protein [Bacillus horti]|uniref:Glutathione synthase/RimK-type ligase-like ATP-grasp enzyme n=1 Tax=Caldalkalibacillus horti TaxID=77523 RepID=A0ABT9W1G3_9BACI|nr:YheC/YheD family protein [Bacillus horti]MDQ0167051.1 glutathione synthase/RimK-type ligase-like ATP-grasp enzyme [Bacillus horti]